jgi:MFS family permease
VNSTINSSALNEWRDHWPVVLSSAAGVALGSIHMYSLGVMIAPLEEEFGWSRTQITSGMVITSLFSILFSPLMGMLIDRIGPRRIALTGVSFYFCTVLLLSRATSEIYTWWSMWTLLGISLLFIKPTVWVTAISSLFSSSRGMALAFILSGTGISSLLTPMLAYYFTEHYGWRSAYVLLACVWALPVLPLIYFFFTSSLDSHRRSSKTVTSKIPVLSGITAAMGFRSLTFYKLAIASLLMAVASVSLVVNLVPILTSKELPRATAVAIAGIVGISQVTGRLLAGYLVDRCEARIVAAICVLLPVSTSLVLLLFPISAPAAVIAVVILGLCAGGELDAAAYLASKHFGMLNFGTLFGAITGVMTLGVGMGPVLASFVYDLTGSYNLVLWAVIPLAMVASYLFWSLGSYPNFPGVTEHQSAIPDTTNGGPESTGRMH